MTAQMRLAIRWAGPPVAVFLAAVITLVLLYAGLLILLYHFMGVDYGAASWAAKSVTTPFVSAALVYASWRFAPARKLLAAAIALGLASLWSGAFLLAGIADEHVPLMLMGSFGMLGGAITFLLLWKGTGNENRVA